MPAAIARPNGIAAPSTMPRNPLSVRAGASLIRSSCPRRISTTADRVRTSPCALGARLDRDRDACRNVAMDSGSSASARAGTSGPSSS
jgi:hypothetical protein